MVFAEKNIVDGLVLLMMAVFSYIFIQRAYIKLPEIRKIPALDAIDEAVGRAAELGKSVLFTTGQGGIEGGRKGPATLSGMNVLSALALKCAELGVPLVQIVEQANILPVQESVTQEAYLLAGKLEDYSPENIQFAGGKSQAWEIAVLAALHRENVGATVHVGYFDHSAVIVAGAGAEAGAFQIGGTNAVKQIAFFIALCDYTFIAEEVLAAGAYLSKDPIPLGSLVAEDWTKIIAIGTIILGAITATLGSNWLINLLKM